MRVGNAMRQMTLASQASFEKYARKSRREAFLNVMDVVVPWGELEALIEPLLRKQQFIPFEERTLWDRESVLRCRAA